MYAKKRLYLSQVEWRKAKDRNAKRIATRGENLACEYLEDKSYKILARNYRAGRVGEIDIIARDVDGIITFVEVKTRTIDAPISGIPELGFDAVDYRKQRKILSASQEFLKSCDSSPLRWSYDVVVVIIPRHPPSLIEIAHVTNAF